MRELLKRAVVGIITSDAAKRMGLFPYARANIALLQRLEKLNERVGETAKARDELLLKHQRDAEREANRIHEQLAEQLSANKRRTTERLDRLLESAKKLAEERARGASNGLPLDIKIEKAIHAMAEAIEGKPASKKPASKKPR